MEWIVKKLMSWYQSFFLRATVWSAGKIFHIVDVYVDKNDNVISVCFSNSEEFIKKVGRIKIKEKK